MFNNNNNNNNNNLLPLKTPSIRYLVLIQFYTCFSFYFAIMSGRYDDDLSTAYANNLASRYRTDNGVFKLFRWHCQHCHFPAESQGQFKAHRKQCPGGKRVSVFCGHCGVIFSSADTLSTHANSTGFASSTSTVPNYNFNHHWPTSVQTESYSDLLLQIPSASSAVLYYPPPDNVTNLFSITLPSSTSPLSTDTSNSTDLNTDENTIAPVCSSHDSDTTVFVQAQAPLSPSYFLQQDTVSTSTITTTFSTLSLSTLSSSSSSTSHYSSRRLNHRYSPISPPTHRSTRHHRHSATDNHLNPPTSNPSYTPHTPNQTLSLQAYNTFLLQFCLQHIMNTHPDSQDRFTPVENLSLQTLSPTTWFPTSLHQNPDFTIHEFCVASLRQLLPNLNQLHNN